MEDGTIGAGSGKLRLALGFVLVFILGFSSGYAYLDGRKPSPSLAFTDRSADCAAIFEKKTASAGTQAGGLPGASEEAPSAAQSAGKVLEASAAADSSALAAGAVAGSKNSNLYHTRDCPYVKRIKAENLVRFGSAQEAEKSGRKPHKCAGG
jgi:hypothetical protein